MSVIKKLVLANLEATKARLSEGRQWIGIKNLEAPDEVQPRAGIDKDWVSQLATFRREGSEFPPARVYQLPDARLILAEGHHRRWALLGENEANMLCKVVDGTMEEAVVYAAGSNRSNGVKPMSPKDVAKAIEMLLGIPKWSEKSDFQIGQKVGCSNGKVRRLRAQRAVELGVPLPETYIASNGVKVASRRWRIGMEGYPSITRHGGRYRTQVSSKKFTSLTERGVKDQVDCYLNGVKAKKKQLSGSNFRNKLSYHGFKVALAGRLGDTLSGPSVSMGTMHGFGMVCAPCDFLSSTGLHEAVGILQLACVAVGRAIAGRQVDRHATRSVVVCYKEDGPQEAIRLFEQAGIEFMTPDELIASLGPVIPVELKSEANGPSTQTD